MTKEPKLQAAMRIVPEWQDYDQEIKLLQSHFQKEKEMGTPATMPGQHTHGNVCVCTSVTFSVPVGLVLCPPSLRACTMHRAEWGPGKSAGMEGNGMEGLLLGEAGVI